MVSGENQRTIVSKPKNKNYEVVTDAVMTLRKAGPFQLNKCVLAKG